MADKIVIRHRITGKVLYEFQPTDEQQASGMAMREALEAATRDGVNLDWANLAGAYLAGAYLARADLARADLAGANLAGAYLARADLAGANLARANLDGANLAGAYLARANLDGADLARADLDGDRPIFQIGPIGSRCAYLVAFVTDQGVRLRAGCFFGTVPEFEEKLQAEHGDNVHAREYRAALELIKVHAALWTQVAAPEKQEAEQ